MRGDYLSKGERGSGKEIVRAHAKGGVHVGAKKAEAPWRKIELKRLCEKHAKTLQDRGPGS